MLNLLQAIVDSDKFKTVLKFYCRLYIAKKKANCKGHTKIIATTVFPNNMYVEP